MAEKSKLAGKPADPHDPDEVGFEEALAGVEDIIARIESGEIGLEASINEYERGVALIARCRKVLDAAEQRVEDLTERIKDQKATRRAESE